MGASDHLGELTRRLSQAAAQGFAAVADDALGAELRAAVDAVLTERGEAHLTELREKLTRFEDLGRQDRSVLVAQGMRVCATLRAGSSEPPARSRRRARPHELAEVPRPRPSRRRVDPAPAGEPPAAEARPDAPVGRPLTELAGVGPSTADKLRSRGLCTVEDLAFLLPRRYVDLRERRPLREVEDGETAVVDAKVRGFRQGFSRGRYLATMQLRAEDGTDFVARWFHRVGGLERVVTGTSIVLVGALRAHEGTATMVHPEVFSPDRPPPAIAVHYPVVEGIGARTLAKLCRAAVARVCDDGPPDMLPQDLVESQGFPPLPAALQLLHDPPHDLAPAELAGLNDGSSPAHRRLAFEEFFVLQTSLLRRRAALRHGRSPLPLTDDAFDRERLRACLPFEPTGAQWRALAEIASDMAEGPPMLRLLQGDVGSGKTAVAFGAALAVCGAGGQVAIMAPTEVLADQHMRTMGPWCEAAGLSLARLTGAMGKGERRSLLALLGAGSIDIVVGTHALLVDDVAFERLALVVVDEQHRFGVEQRAILRGKGARPHLLVMTATPIPRSLALTAYGELEVSVIDEMPPGRTPPVTRVYCGRGALERARSVLAKGVNKGARAFVVCPLVERSEVLDVSDVEASAAALRELLPEHRVGIVHGRLPSKDKDEIMESFRDGRLDVLVATTVIEVGVDVPDARVILVEHAERFGLAQLHQLRGRVGRGQETSACLLHTSQGPASEAGQRLGVLAQTHDGFVVAERDLALRGPGEVFGTRQAGVPRLRFAGFAGEGARLLAAARHAAADLLHRDPGLAAHPVLRAEVERREASAPIHAGDSG